MAITKSKSLSIYYKFVAWLICLTEFLGRMFSPPISVGNTSRSDGLAATERQVDSSGMSHVGHTNSIMNDEPGPHIDISGKSSLNPSLEPSR